MKSFQILLLAFFVVSSFTLIIPHVLAFGCTIRSGSCNSVEVCLFSLYQQTNSHVADCSTYNYKICCDFISANIRATCNADEVGLFSMNKISNSHLEIYGSLNYQNQICVQEEIICNLKSACGYGEACVASFYSNLNSHAADCSYYSNKLCCRSLKPYEIIGMAFYYDTGLPIESGKITGIIKETGETSNATIANGQFNLKFNTTADPNVNKFTLGLIVNASGTSMGYTQIIVGSGSFVTSVTTCSIKQWHFSGRAVDDSGLPLSSGNVQLSVQGETQIYTNSTSFSNGLWDVYISPCLIAGNIYTFQITVTSGGETSNSFIMQLAK